MNYQYKTEEYEVVSKKLKCDPDYYAWPQIFADSGGPRKGVIVMHAFTTFTVHAYVSSSKTILYCNRVWKEIETKDFTIGMDFPEE